MTLEEIKILTKGKNQDCKRGWIICNNKCGGAK